eukprot:CAMPEP_0183706352 /NCGR_PEP_ID=MMETSP0737-20130205/3226_1 /TAXON_ID=385413 /ORGANISM="Thalassiosira miniscula, Strain CCMP1093" /LENGTH=651 /DNA_ID=CAMNT_0025933763 /DNA_START=60 /DNA_END=2015 /DNA_ORIENTATION=-
MSEQTEPSSAAASVASAMTPASSSAAAMTPSSSASAVAASATAAASSSSNSNKDPLSGVDIGKIMSSKGPIVKCVLLRATLPSSSSDNDGKASASATMEVDPTRDASSMSIKELKFELASYGVDGATFVEKGELIRALEEARSNLTPRGGGSGSEAREDGGTNADKVEAQDDNNPNNDNPNNDSKKNDNDNNASKNNDDKANGSTNDNVNDNDSSSKPTKTVPLQHLISEIEVDTTPRKSMVAKVLGGDFTFLGQFEEEGTMVMIRRAQGEDGDGKEEDGGPLPVNPHELQPPLHEARVRGDILLMRVAKTEEELDEEDEDNEDEENENENEKKGSSNDEGAKKDENDEKEGAARNDNDGEATSPQIHVPTNDEFFLDYTKEEYIKFAARTDIVAEDPESSDDDEEEESEEEAEGEEEEDGKPSAELGAATAMLLATEEGDSEDEHDANFDPDSDEDSLEGPSADNEEHQIGMMNMILSHMLRKFREENGRGPDSLELLEMRKALADRLGVEVPPVDGSAGDWNTKVGSKEEREGRREDDSKERKKKRVVVAEEKNETEEIPRREGASDEDEDDALEDVEEMDDEALCDVEYEEGANGTVLKRPAQDVLSREEDGKDGDQPNNSNKRQRTNGTNGYDSHDNATKVEEKEES